MPARQIRRERDRPASPSLLIETGLAIIVASLALRLIPFNRLAEMLGKGTAAATEADEETAYWLRRSVLALARRVPWRALCFEQGIAAHLLLRRRQLATTLHYGAATIDGELQAHVWVTSGSTEVVGCENKNRFAQIAQFGG